MGCFSVCLSWFHTEIVCLCEEVTFIPFVVFIIKLGDKTKKNSFL